MKKNFTRILCLSAAVVLFSGAALAAPSFSDVESTHPAYGAIIRVCEAGYLSEDTENKFNPDNFIDKFDTALIMAYAAGFKPEAEKSEKALEYTDLIEYYEKTYLKWNAKSNDALAFLLSKGILSVNDLKTFIGIRQDGSEGVRALTREEAALYFTRAFGKTEDAKKAAVTDVLLDDRILSASAREAVYYIKSLGVPLFSEKNAFSPKSAITKAELAMLIDALTGGGTTAPPKTEQPAAAPAKQEAAQTSAAPTAEDLGLKVTGRLVQIRITGAGAYVTIADGNVHTEYKTLAERVDLLALVLDSYVTVYLDSYKAELVCGIEPATEIEAKG